MKYKAPSNTRQGHLEFLLGRVDYWSNKTSSKAFWDAVSSVGEYVLKQRKYVTIASGKPKSKKQDKK